MNPLLLICTAVTATLLAFLQVQVNLQMQPQFVTNKGVHF